MLEAERLKVSHRLLGPIKENDGATLRSSDCGTAGSASDAGCDGDERTGRAHDVEVDARVAPPYREITRQTPGALDVPGRSRLQPGVACPSSGTENTSLRYSSRERVSSP